MNGMGAGACEDELAARLIAFYLPQFYPIPENDEWWEKGFTEWTNVAKAKPLFRGHYQPKLPADLGFYDLRVPEVRKAQADMARECGIEGFCYWHYWFGNGRRILERPFNEVLNSGEPDFPFCLGWANMTWTGIWHGAPDRVLIKQEYPGIGDYKEHFYEVLPALKDPRYIKVSGKPVFVVYKPMGIPDPNEFTRVWRGLALKEGLCGLYFAGIENFDWQPEKHGFDALIPHLPGVLMKQKAHSPLDRLSRKIFKMNFDEWLKKTFRRPRIVDFKNIIDGAYRSFSSESSFLPCVVPNWDNTARSGIDGVVLTRSSPELFEEALKFAVSLVASRNASERLIFIKSWNEWAEGNYLEPDRRYGKAYLEVVKNVVCK